MPLSSQVQWAEGTEVVEKPRRVYKGVMVAEEESEAEVASPYRAQRHQPP